MTEMNRFETAYPAYPFAALVDFGLALSRLYLRARRPRAEGPKAGPQAAACLR